MDHFNYRDGNLFAEDVAVAEIAKQFGTPCYIYSRATLERHWRVFDTAFSAQPHQICYAVKANSNLAVLDVLARLGSGFDIVSLGELERVLAAGGDPKKIIFSGVGKQDQEIKRALEVGIACFDVESLTELHRINAIATKLKRRTPVALRINPNIDAGTHPYITTGKHANKFGIDHDQALQAAQLASDLEYVELVGLACHLGSQLTTLEPFKAGIHSLLALTAKLRSSGIPIRHLNMGGGLGVRYQTEEPPSPQAYATSILDELRDYRDLLLTIEPGRAIVANAGLLVMKVDYVKHTPERSFAIVDAGMNDLIRPALYGSWHEIIPVKPRATGEKQVFDIVGPLCESGDFLGQNRQLILEHEDLLAVRTAGAYGFSMSSNYNSRPRVAEIMVDGKRSYVVRKREQIKDLFATESKIP